MLECLGEIPADDEDHPAEPGANGIIDRVVEHGLTVGAHRIHLFEAAITAAHSGGKDDKGRLHGIYQTIRFST